MAAPGDSAALVARIQALLGAGISGLARLGGGRNSQVWLTVSDAGRRYVVKWYYTVPGAGRDRLDAEWRALVFLRARGLDCVPRPVTRDASANLAVFEYIAGRVPDAETGRVESLLGFMGRLLRLRQAPGASELPPAADSLPRPATVIGQIQARLDRLRLVPEPSLERFLRDEFDPAWRRLRSEAPKVWPDGGPAILSPSDFGFHNAILSPDGRMYFVDFEYFGWDDPAKLIGDTILHPHENMGLSEAQSRSWLDGMLELHRDDAGLSRRARLLLPFLALKWSLILLNEFLPLDAGRRAFAGRVPGPEVFTHQLEKAQRMLEKGAEMERALFPGRLS